MSEHQWGEERDRIRHKVRSCVNDGCTVRTRLVGVLLEQWQSAKGHHWHPIPKAGAHCAVPIPPCSGVRHA